MSDGTGSVLDWLNGVPPTVTLRYYAFCHAVQCMIGISRRNNRDCLPYTEK